MASRNCISKIKFILTAQYPLKLPIEYENPVIIDPNITSPASKNTPCRLSITKSGNFFAFSDIILVELSTNIQKTIALDQVSHYIGWSHIVNPFSRYIGSSQKNEKITSLFYLRYRYWITQARKHWLVSHEQQW